MKATIYNASAGSGKTYTLAYKYVRDVIEEPMLYRNILAVTFTNKATEEMKSRILREVHSLASTGGESAYLSRLVDELGLSADQVQRRAIRVRKSILHDYSRFTILTIDRFFQRIIRAFIQELGIDINYNIELDPSLLLAQSADRIIEDISQNSDLRQWIEEFIEERIEDGKSWDIHDGILSLGAEIFKESNRDTLESAPSKDKLKGIVERLSKDSEVAKSKIIALGERAMDIISGASLTPESFSGKSRSFAKYFAVVASGEIKEPTATVKKRAESSDGWGDVSPTIVDELQPILRDIVDLYEENIKLWNTTSLVRENYRSFALLSDLYNRVGELCNEQNLMLLSETKLILSKFIEENDAPFIYEKVGNRFERYMIDEFQDTSLKEWENFLPLLSNTISQSEKNSVLLVGDIKQSIYRWRGGDWRILHQKAREDIGVELTEVINLKENYRSLPNIVEFNNAIIESVVESDNAKLDTLLKDAKERGAISDDSLSEMSGLLRQAYSEHKQTPRKGEPNSGYVEITTHNDEPQIVERIKSILDLGYKPCEILILVRSNSEGVKVANKLLEFKGENQCERYYFDVMTQEALVVGSAPVTQFIIATLRLALNREESIQRAIFNRFLGKSEIGEAISEEDIALLESIRLDSCEEAFERIVMHFGLSERESSIAYLQAIHESIIGFCSSKSGDIAQFLKWWEEHGAKRSISVEQSDKSIEITTIHKAKGLEKEVVIIPYCGWPLDPKSSGSGKASAGKPSIGSAIWADGQEQIDQLGAFPVKYKKAMGESLFSEQYYREFIYSHIDNINMLYVALTRASKQLHIFIKNGKLGVGRAISESIKTSDEGGFSIGELSGKMITEDLVTRYTFGEFCPPKTSTDHKVDRSLYIMSSYPTSQADLRLRLPSQRYFEQMTPQEQSPREVGILMHKAFAESETAEDISRSITAMRLNGVISEAEYNSINSEIKHALESDPIKEWFSPEWEVVRNEHAIIVPKESNFKRPDRVMISGDRAIVVDYKFGEGEHKRYHRQVAEYISLLEKMGYRDVKGYIWYIKSGKVVSI